MFRIALLIGLFISTVSSIAQAAQSEYLHQPVLSTRVMGMGGAFTAVADDYNALFYNAAGLAWRDSGQLNFMIQGMVTPNIFSFYNDLSGAGSNSTNITNVLGNYVGSHFASRVSLGGIWVRPEWGVAIVPVDLSLEADIHGTAGYTVGVQAYQDSLIQFAKAWGIGEKKNLAIGVAPKVIYRAYFEKDLTVFDLVQSTSLFRPSDAQEGLTFDTDVGVLYRVEPPESGWFKWLKYAKPTFGFAVRNLLDLGFKTNFHLLDKDSSIVTGSRMERRFDLGSKWELPEFWVFKPRVMIDGRDMGSRYASFKKSFHVGAELLWKAFGWLNGGYRIGVSQGYLTAGVSAELGIFLLDVATYAEEIGTASSPRESRRYIVRASLDF
jgi:hypothetical protein